MVLLADLLSEERVELGFDGSDRREVLAELGRVLGGSDTAVQETVRDELTARERIGTTGVGGGVAFPHARVDLLSVIRVALVRTIRPVEFSALDGRPVDLFVGVAGPREGRRDYLSVLSRLSWMLRDDADRDAFRDAATPADALILYRARALVSPRNP